MSKTAAEIEQDIFRSLEASRNYVEQAIQAEIDTWQGPPNLIEAMKYAVMSGGKRIRPVLAIEIARLIGGEAVVQRTHSAACALEWIHTYSLVHDDLPAMDDDDERRGRPTVHRKFNEALAILAGDALQTEAFELCAKPDGSGRSADIRAKQTASIAKWAGARGMCGGQAIDIANLAQGPEQLRAMHAGKTGALFIAACEIAAYAGGCTDYQVDAWGNYGARFGLAYQLSDDVMDLDEVQTSDHEANVNLAQLLGTEKALLQLQKDSAEGHILLHRLGVPEDHVLHQLLDWNLARAEGALA